MSAFLLVLFAIVNRVYLASGSHLPHAWWNFTAVGGSLLFFGARRPLRQAWIPVVALMVTDYVLTTRMYGYPFSASNYVMTWAWYGAAILIGAAMLRKHATAGRIIAASVISSTSFFIISNFIGFYSASVFPHGFGYPHSFAGMMQAYAAAIPFYRNDLISTLFVTGAAFSAVAWARQRQHASGTAAA